MSPAVGDLVLGRVSEMRPEGAVIVLAGGGKGFLPLAEVSEEAVGRVEDRLHEGQELLFKVIGFDSSGQPLLSLARVTDRDRESFQYHQEVVRMRSALSSRSVNLAPDGQQEERIEWRLARWLKEAEAVLARFRRSRAKRLSEHFYSS